jgi:hypothetical protein
MQVKYIFVTLGLALLPVVIPAKAETASAGPTIRVYQSPT